MLQLHNLDSSGKKRKRVGRGGSRGGTSGRGHKGQKARTSGTIPPRFEGGQMPLHRRLPKRGFNNKRFADQFDIVSVGRLEQAFDSGAEVTRQALVEKGIIKLAKSKGRLLKILGDGQLSKQLTVHADAFSKTAQSAIEGSGGKVMVTQR